MLRKGTGLLRAFALCLLLMSSPASAASGELVFPEELKEIGVEAFAGNTSMTKAKLPVGMTKIGARAFQNCTRLSRVVIPTSVTSIGKNAFSGCPSLEIECYLGSKAYSYAKANGIDTVVKVGFSRQIYNLDWFKHKDCLNDSGIDRGKKITLIDVDTGRHFTGKVQYASGNHADVEPLTSSDTKVLCGLYGVDDADELESEDKYERRALVVQAGSRQFVASIYAVPHGEDTLPDNGYDGQFCVHFKNSKTHGSGKVDPDHQGMISSAVKYLNGRKNKEGEKIQIVTACPVCD